MIFMKSFFNGCPNTEAFNNIVSQSFEEHYSTIIYYDTYYHFRLRYEYLCIEAIMQNDETKFNESLQKGLEFHKSFWGQKPRKRSDYDCRSDAGGFISLTLLAVCCLAHDKGMNITVESDYLPKWMIEGDF